jgi:hypothetical protein
MECVVGPVPGAVSRRTHQGYHIASLLGEPPVSAGTRGLHNPDRPERETARRGICSPCRKET